VDELTVLAVHGFEEQLDVLVEDGSTLRAEHACCFSASPSSPFTTASPESRLPDRFHGARHAHRHAGDAHPHRCAILPLRRPLGRVTMPAALEEVTAAREVCECLQRTADVASATGGQEGATGG
jgi:hypothetical protein